MLDFYARGDDNFGYALNLAFPDGSEWRYAPFERAPRPGLATKTGKLNGLRRPTPTANRCVVRSPRCPECRSRAGSVDPGCACHGVGGGTLYCGCPGCQAPDVWHRGNDAPKRTAE